MDYGNVIHLPIIEVDDQDTPVVQVVPSPELHLLLGPTNLMIEELGKVWGECHAWLQSLHVTKEEYFGGNYEGNECRKILKKSNSLETRCPQEFQQFVKSLTTFNDVVASCFGKNLSNN